MVTVRTHLLFIYLFIDQSIDLLIDVYLRSLAMTSLFGTGSVTGAVAGSGWAGLAPRVVSTWPGRCFRCRGLRRWRRRRRRRRRRRAEVARHLAEIVECWRWLGVHDRYCRPRGRAQSRTPSTIYCLSQPSV